MKLAKVLLPLFILALLVTPTLAAHITAFNGVAASVEDQVNTIRLAVGQSGNVSVIFDYGYTLDTTNTTLVIDFSAANISAYSYSATGDTANLTVVRNSTNLTFKYSGPTSVTISSVNLTFNFSKSLTVSEGINTGSAFLTPKVLAYVSDYITPRTPDNTTEKVMYLVYDPFQVYAESFKVTSPKNATITVSGNNITIDLTNATTNLCVLKISIDRGNYTDALVPIQKGYITVKLNNTYITQPLTLATINATEVGSYDENGYTIIKYLDTATNYTKIIDLRASFWNTNGTLKDGIIMNYTIDPIGGIPVSVDRGYNLNVTSAMVAGVITPMFWAVWKYQFLGIPVLAWFGIIAAVAFFAIMIYRVRKGMSPIPKSSLAKASIVGIWTYIFAITTLKDWWHSAFVWVANNPLPAIVIFTLLFMLLLLAKIHLTTTRE